MESLIEIAEFRSQEAKDLFLQLEQQEQTDNIIRAQIEAYKRNPQALIQWALAKKVEDRNKQLLRNGLHPIV